MKVIEVKITDVTPYENNPRLNDGAVVDAVAASIREFGFRQPIVVDSDYVIIAGHVRWKAACKLGLCEIPVHIASMPPEKVRAYRIADNKIAECASWDMDKLVIELEDLTADSIDLSLLGFDDSELAKLLDLAEPEKDADAAPDLPENPVSIPGVIYQLGRHRLMCANSLKPENVWKAVNAHRVALVFTDPPYNMNYKSKNLGGIQNDRMSEASFVAFILKSAAALKRVMKAHASYYICMSAAAYPTVYYQLRKLGMSGRQIVWVKPSAGLGGQEYRPQYEVMLYGYVGTKKGRTWTADRRESDFWDIDYGSSIIPRSEGNQTVIEISQGIETTQIYLDGKVTGNIITFDGHISDLWRFSRPSGKYVHPTQKPVALISHAILNSSNPGDTVLDIFGGSGSTLIACEQTDRSAVLMELDPKYCDVIRRRWAEFVHGPDCDWQTLTPEAK
jgi:DNA modification methylase